MLQAPQTGANQVPELAGNLRSEFGLSSRLTRGSPIDVAVRFPVRN